MGGRSLCSAPAECPRATSWTTASSWGECPQWGGVGPCAWVPPAAGGCCPSCPGSTKPATTLEASPLLLRGLFHLIYSFVFGCAGSSLLHRLFSICVKRGLLWWRRRGSSLQ